MVLGAWECDGVMRSFCEGMKRWEPWIITGYMKKETDKNSECATTLKRVNIAFPKWPAADAYDTFPRSCGTSFGNLNRMSPPLTPSNANGFPSPVQAFPTTS